MKESILDVLLYLFEHYFTNEDVDPGVRDQDSLQKDLLQAGFSPAEITRAFEWLEALDNGRPGDRPGGVRPRFGDLYIDFAIDRGVHPVVQRFGRRFHFRHIAFARRERTIRRCCRWRWMRAPRRG